MDESLEDRSAVVPIVAVYQRSVMAYRRPFFDLTAKLLGDRGFKLVIYSADEGDAENASIEIGVPHYVSLGSLYKRRIAAREIQEQLIVPRGLLRRLWIDKPSVIVSEDISALPANLVMPLLKRFRNVPYLIWTLGPEIPGKNRSRWRFLFKPVIALLRRSASAFITYSHWGRASLQASYDKPVITAPNSSVTVQAAFSGCDVEPNTPLRVLFIGRLVRQKHVDRLLRAVALASIPVTVDIVGDGEDRSRLESLAKTLGCENAVHFHGDVRDQLKKNEFIDNCHCGVMPGLGGLFVQELQARGRPVIVGPADGTEIDLVRDVNPDFFLPHVSAEALAMLFERLVSYPELLKRAQLNAWQIVRDEYNITRMAECWVAAVTTVASSFGANRN